MATLTAIDRHVRVPEAECKTTLVLKDKYKLRDLSYGSDEPTNAECLAECVYSIYQYCIDPQDWMIAPWSSHADVLEEYADTLADLAEWPEEEEGYGCKQCDHPITDGEFCSADCERFYEADRIAQAKEEHSLGLR